MRKSELFHAYLDGSITAKQTVLLKEYLQTAEGSEKFVRFMAESGTICELLNKKEIHLTKQSEIKSSTKKRKKRNPSPMLFIIPALAACAVFVFFLLSRQSEFILISDGRSVEIGQTVTASANETLIIKSAAGTINISEEGSFKVISKNSIRVSKGSFEFNMKSRDKDNPFSVKTTHGLIKIIGTSFKVKDTDTFSFVSVSEGKVELTDSLGKKHYLTNGQSRTSRSKSDLYSGLEAYYTFKNGPQDSSGNNRTAVPRKNAGIQDVDNNMAGVFTLEAHFALPKILIEGPYTLSSWVKLNGNKKPFMSIIANGDKSWRLTLFENSFNVHFCGTGLSKEYVNSTRELTLGKWQLVTGVYDGKSLKIYIDGKLDNKTAVEGSYNQSDFQLEIGGNNQAHFRNFEGALDGVMIYSRALSDGEVLNLFKRGRP